jgi:hypothetical protein
MDKNARVEDHGEWFNFRLLLGDTELPVRISREAMEDHFGAEAFESLVHAYRHHAEQLHVRLAALVVPGVEYTREQPLVVHTKDL